jgi:hypothetical protein
MSTIEHPQFEGKPIMIGDLIQVETTDQSGPWSTWIEVTAISVRDAAPTFQVGSEYWTVYLTQAAATAEQGCDDRFWVVGHRSSGSAS